MNDSTKSGATMTRAEALDALAQCALLKVSIQILEKKAKEALRKPELRLVDEHYENNPMDWEWLRD